VPFPNTNQTGLFSNQSNFLQLPDNASNKLIGSLQTVDAVTVPGSIIIGNQPASLYNPNSGVNNTPVPLDGPFGTSSGTSTVTTLQLLEIIAVLVLNQTDPVFSAAYTGLFLNQGNNYQFPDNAANQLLGSQTAVYTDGVWLYVQQLVGQPSSGA
jgi:hypothetical protein